MALNALTSKLPAPLQPFGWLIVPLLVFLLIAIMALSVLPGMVNKQAYGELITMQVESLTGRSFTYDSMNVKLFPTAKLTMYDVRLENAPGTTRNYMLLAPVVEIPISFGAAFSDEASVSEVILYDAALELESLSNGSDNWHFAQQSGFVSGTSVNIRLRNSEVIYTDKRAGYVENIQGVNGTFSVGRGRFGADISLRLRQRTNNVKAECTSVNFQSFQTLQAQCDVTLSEGQNTLGYKGDVYRTQAGSAVKGNLTVQHADIREWLDIWYGTGAAAYSNYFANPVPVVLTAEIFSNHERWLFKASALNSGEGSKGSGFVDIKRTEPSSISSQFSFERLDLDALLGSTLTHSTRLEDNLLANPDGLPYELTGQVRVQADQWKMLGVEGASFVADGRFDRGRFELSAMQMGLEENGRVAAKGRITIDETGPRFDGKIDMAAKRFAHLSPLLGLAPTSYPEAYNLPVRARFSAALSTQSMLISDLRGLVGAAKMRGSATITPFASPPSVDTKISIDKWDLTPLYTHWFGQASLTQAPDDLGYNPFLLDGLARFNWIWKNELDVQKARYFDREDMRVALHTRAQANGIGVSRFAIDKPQGTSLEGQARIALRDRQTPDIELTINANSIHLEDLFADYMLATPEERSASEKNDQWTDRAFNFNPLLHFDMRLNVRAALITHDWFDAFDVAMEADSINGRVAIKELKANMFDGDWVVKSVLELGLIPKFSLGFTGAGVQLDSFLDQMVDVDEVNGAASLGGQLQATGLSFSDWMEALRGAVSIQSYDVAIDGLNVGEVIAAGKSGAAPTALRKRVESVALTGRTPFRSLEGSLYIDQGFVQFTKMALRSRQAAGEVTGNIRLTDYTADVKLDLGLIGLAGRNRQFPQMAVRVKGPVAQPKHIVETQELENFLSRK